VSQPVVVTFDGEETAAEALRGVRTVEKAGALAPSDTAVVVENREGTVNQTTLSPELADQRGRALAS
jgi:uncharacterized membrane protein